MKNQIKSFQDLVVWEKSHELTLGVYQFTRQFPDYEENGLSQLFRRSAAAIPANIVEGSKRSSKADKVYFFNKAQGALEEVKYYLILARDLRYADPSELLETTNEVEKLLEDKIKNIQGLLSLFA